MSVATKILGQQSWDTDAEFRADALAVHNAMVATGGLVQTADTGQTDFTANTRAAGGYTVYRFDDTHQSSYPLFLRIDWTPQVVNTRPSFRFTLGTGSSGAGVITGVIQVITQVVPTAAGATGAATGDYYVSIGDGYLYILLSIVASADNEYGSMLMIERSTDEEGVVHPEEGVILFASGANGLVYGIYPTGFASIVVGNCSPFLAGLNWVCWDDLVGTDVGMMPSPYIMRKNMRFHRMILYRGGRVSYGTAIDVEHLAATRKVMPIESNYMYGANGWVAGQGLQGPAFAIPWL